MPYPDGVIDLHTHTRASDGTESPAELMAAAARAGLTVVGLTDHDTTAGWAEAVAAVPGSGVSLVRGTEISCTAGGISVHLLSYLHDPADPALAGVFADSRSHRATRAADMVARLGRDLPISWDDVLAEAAPGATIGRPHIADALVRLGIVPDRTAAFAGLLSPHSPYYVRYTAPEAVAAVAAVRAAGGVPVMAHPRASGRGRVVSDAVIARMVEAGLAGLEVDHRDHTPAERAELVALAGRHGLLRTGSSDYHGAGKPNRLGENTTSREVLAAITAQGRLGVVHP
ncbi:PHP domain-containing protein [Pseudactinotalea sp. HY158]|nr:PHP domain-containing protein [Pseudactinotalea sp. HY158]